MSPLPAQVPVGVSTDAPSTSNQTDEVVVAFVQAPDDVSGLKLLGQRLDYPSYLRLAGALTRDHAFWDGLLPPFADGEALVLENRVGAVSLGLADRFRTIHCLPATGVDVDVVSRRVQRSSRRNVRVVTLDIVQRLPERSLSAVVMLAPSVSIRAGESAETKTNAEILLAGCARWLRPDGVLLVADNNRMSYHRWLLRRGDSEPGFWAMTTLARQLAQRGLTYQRHLSNRTELPAELWPPPEFLAVDAVEPRPIGANAVKEVVLNSKRLRHRWPSFLCTFARAPVTSAWEEVVRASETDARMGWPAGVPFRLKRLIAGNAEVAIGIVGPAARHDLDVVVRMPRGDLGRARCMTNARALAQLADTTMAEYVPRAVVSGEWAGQGYHIETRCRGGPLLSDRIDAGDAIRMVCRQWLDFQLTSRERTSLTTDDYSALVGRLFADIRRYLDHGADHDRLAALEEWLRRALLDQPLPLVYGHGDFKLGNLLFDRHCALTAIIDWDRAVARGLPLLDHLLLLIYQLRHRVGGLQKAFVQHILPWQLAPGDAWFGEEPAARLAVTERQFLALRVVLWLQILSEHFSVIHKLHDTWRQDVVSQTLTDIEAHLARAG